MGAALQRQETRTAAMRRRRPNGLLRAASAAVRAAALAASVLAIAPAAAQTIYAPGQGAPNSKALPIQVTASVGTRCAFAAGAAPTGTFTQASFDTTGFTHDFPFTLECTGPSRVAVVSTNGGMLNDTTVPTGYANKAPYDVTLNLASNNAGTTGNQTCAAATLTSGSSCSFVGPASEQQGLRLAAASVGQSGSYLRVSAPAYAGASSLVAGTYSDRLIVTVSISP
jgi:hypothetical protein